MNVGQGYKGPLGSNMSGAIINCYTDISGTGTCGFARRLTDAGIVSNSYSVSEAKAGAFFNQYGTNDTAGEGQLINTYWLETLDNSVIPESALVNSYSETKDYMKSLVLKYRTGRSGKLRIINLSVMGDTLKNQKIIYM